MELSKLQKQNLGLLYDSRLNVLPKLSDVYDSEELNIIKSRNIDITGTNLNEQQKFLSKVCVDYLQSGEVGTSELISVTRFAKDINSKLKLEVPNKAFNVNKVSLNDALFIETKYVAYFLSNLVDPRKKSRPLLKVNVSKLGKDLYRFQEEVIIISDSDYNFISELVINQINNDDETVSGLISKIASKLWSTYIHDDTYNAEYIINNPTLVSNVNNHIDFLIKKYLVGINTDDFLDENNQIWKKVGYKLYDNRGHQLFSSKTKTLKSQM